MSSGGRNSPTGPEINRMLAGQLDSLIPWLLPNAVRSGPFWCVGSIHGERGDSLKIHATGLKAGAWADYACSKGDPNGTGDLIKLLQLTVGGGDITVAFTEAKRFLNLDTMDPVRIEQLRERARRASERNAARQAGEHERKRRNAERLWLSSERLTASSAPIKYLESRGIDFAKLGKLPGAIRYHPKVPHGEASALAGARRLLPAMVTKISDLEGRHVGTHLTFLEFGRHGWTKLAPLEIPDPKTGELVATGCAKKIWGPTYYGGHIPLWKGAQTCKLGDVAPGTAVDVSEGIEDALTWAMVDPACRVVAAGTLGNIGAMKLPPQLGDFRILAQRDEKEKAQEALERAVREQQEQARLQGSARKVILRWPKPGFNDWNDWLRGVAQ